MSVLFEIMTKVEHQAVQLERARAVLSEVQNYFESKDSEKWLPYYAEHILLLLHVADGLLFDMLPELEKAIDALLELHKSAQKGKVGTV